MIIKSPPFYDVSHWKSIPDFYKVSPRPLLFGTKATEGTSLVDSKFVTFFDGMKSIGVHRLAYHFHRKALTAYDQARHFINTVRPYITQKDIIALDVEEGGETAAQLKKWFEYVMAEFPNNEYWIYSRKNLLDPISMFLKLILDETLIQPALNSIQMTLAERDFFTKKTKTWVAGYPTNPDLYTSVPSFYIPDQTKWGPVAAWQYSAKGQITGIVGEVDLNWMSPQLIASLQTPDTHTVLFDGVEQYAGIRHGWKFWLQIIDPSKVDYEVLHPYPRKRVSDAANTKGAKIATNGGEWDRLTGVPKDYSVANGNVYVERKQAVPSLMTLTSGAIVIGHKNIPDVQQAISGLRYLVLGGLIPSYLYGTEPQYIEGHSRTIEGLTADGKHIQMVSEGLYPNQGLTLKQAAEIMIQYKAITAFDSGGGGDSALVVNGQVLNQPEDINIDGKHVERYLPQILLIYPQEGDNMYSFEAIAIGDNTKLRPNHNTLTDLSPAQVYFAGTKFQGDVLWTATIDNKDTSQYVGDKWLEVKAINGNALTIPRWVAVIHRGVPICTLKENSTSTSLPVQFEHVLIAKDVNGAIIGTWKGTLTKQ